MDAARLDWIAKVFARRRLTRRQALGEAGVGLAAVGLTAAGLTNAAAAQNATPEPDATDAVHSPTMLFVQSFQSGSIAPTEGTEGRFTVTLERGLGQTIYFSDRPDRIVGATPTPRFLAGLGFPEDNPPNAALVVETAAGETDIAVVELFAPVYDEASHTATYEVAVLANWEDSLALGFTQAPADLAAVAPSFGAAHLFIDSWLDCDADAEIRCMIEDTSGIEDFHAGTLTGQDFGGWCDYYDANADYLYCRPCDPRWKGNPGYAYAMCNELIADCHNQCYAEES